MLGVVGLGRAGKAIYDETNGMNASIGVDPRRYRESVKKRARPAHRVHRYAST